MGEKDNGKKDQEAERNTKDISLRPPAGLSFIYYLFPASLTLLLLFPIFSFGLLVVVLLSFPNDNKEEVRRSVSEEDGKRIRVSEAKDTLMLVSLTTSSPKGPTSTSLSAQRRPDVKVNVR